MKAHYIIFHPEHQRQKQAVSATSLVGGKIVLNWTGDIFVDKIVNGNEDGNEDPFVFNDPWIYSYCHASQLRRNKSHCYIQRHSWLFFVSGQFADQGLLTIDTAFLVNNIHLWGQPDLQLPLNFQYLNSKRSDKLWKRHFKFPFQGQHSGVTHSYEAELWHTNNQYFSFLPYTAIGDRVSIPISSLTNSLANKITTKIRGKYPVLLNNLEINKVF